MKILFAGDFCPINRVEALALKGKADAVYGILFLNFMTKICLLLILNAP